MIYLFFLFVFFFGGGGGVEGGGLKPKQYARLSNEVKYKRAIMALDRSPELRR